MSKNKTSKPLHVRLGASSQRVREWAELTGKSENATAEFFAGIGLVIAESPNNEFAEQTRKSTQIQLKSMCEAQKLRKQASALNKRAAQIVRDAKR